MSLFAERFAGRQTRMKAALLIAVMAVFVVLLGRAAAQGDEVVPTFTIESVAVDQSVTILAQNFPANQEFVVTMGPIGTLGINGTPVAITNSGLLGAFSATYPIPDGLKGSRQISIRLQSPQGYYSYNWFWNNLSEPARAPIPTISIDAVDINESVTIRTHNFPANRTFLVTMGHMGTLGVGGTPVGTLYSGDGGEMTATFPIPVLLKGLERIAIRTQSDPFYSYNWFNNQTEPLPIPTFRVCAVVRDGEVTIRTNPSFPANRSFAVMMNYMGTLGIDGYIVGSFNSGPTGVATATYSIPSGLRGLDQIQIRTEEIGGPFYSFNYFSNQTAVYCAP